MTKEEIRQKIETIKEVAEIFGQQNNQECLSRINELKKELTGRYLMKPKFKKMFKKPKSYNDILNENRIKNNCDITWS